MHVVRNLENFTELEKKQMETINNLHEKIKLLEFDKTKDISIKNGLRKKIKISTNTVNKAIIELEMMRRKNDYTEINYVIRSLKLINKEETYEER